jgi:hypothetical protein
MKPAAIGAPPASGFVDGQQVSGPEDNDSQRSRQQGVELTSSNAVAAARL